MIVLVVLHGLFFATFLTRKLREPRSAGGPRLAEGQPARTAPRARTLLFLHAAAFGILYFGLGRATQEGAQAATAGRVAGGALVLAATALVAWTLRVFRSWRMLAEVSGGHELTTTGPFAYVRHPLYAALDLLALGTALWVPHPTVIAGALLAAFVGDRRARTEERLLLAVYGDAYARYAARVRRLVPGLY